MANYNASEKEKKLTSEYDQKRATGADQKYNLAAQKTYSQIQNYGDFEYDVNGDALYHQYKDQATRQGKLAMQDAIGKASAMTGGYGNSYAQQVGQQTFNGYMQDLNDTIPELYALAYDKHIQGLNNLYKQYDLENNAYLQTYGEYMDDLSLLSSEISSEQAQNWNKTNLQAQNEANQATITAAQIKADAEAAKLNSMTPAEQYEMMQILSEFKENRDPIGLNHYLTGLRDQKYISDEYMDELYETYLWQPETIKPKWEREQQTMGPLPFTGMK